MTLAEEYVAIQILKMILTWKKTWIVTVIMIRSVNESKTSQVILSRSVMLILMVTSRHC